MPRMAAWDGDKLTLWTSNQMIAWNTADIAKTLGMPKENVRLISPYRRRRIRRQAVSARRCAAGRVGRPCRRSSREGCPAATADVQQYHPSSGDDPAHPHRRDPDGKITAIGHESWSGDLPEWQGRWRRCTDTHALCGRQSHDRNAGLPCSTCRKAMRCARRARPPA